MPTAGRPTPPQAPYRLIRANRHIQDAIVSVEHHQKDYDPHDPELRRALDYLYGVKLLIGQRIQRATP